MKKLIIFSFVIMWFLPQGLFAATVTEDALSKLGFYGKSGQSFLSDTSTWQCGEIESKAVKYSVKNDVIVYDEINHIWWHLFTPMSTEMPIEALALRMDDNGEVTRQIVILRGRECEKVSRPKLFSQKKAKEVIVEQKPVEDVLEDKNTSSKVAKANNSNSDTLIVASTWELMKLYRQQTGEER